MIDEPRQSFSDGRRPDRLPRLWIPGLTLAVIVSGMAYTLWWPAVVDHTSWHWQYPGDIWGSVRAAHWIGWGAFSYIYSSHVDLVTLPGLELILAPVVMLGSKLGLTETAPGLLPVPKPTEWLLVGPLVMAGAAVALYGFDALAKALGVSRRHRYLLSVAEAVALWPTIVLWGHPEDVIAMGLCALALSRGLKGQQVSAGWLLGAAIVMQLYVIAVVPVFLGFVGIRKAPSLLGRAAVLPLVVTLAVLIPNAHATLHALLDQPNYPKVDFPTPWVLVAPRIAKGVVSAGPGRMAGLGVAVGLGALAARWRSNLTRVIWLAAIALAVRCLFESVMDPYYVAPAIGFFLVTVADRKWVRYVLTCLIAAGLTELTYFRTGIWWYWIEMFAAFAALTALTWSHGRLTAAADARGEAPTARPIIIGSSPIVPSERDEINAPEPSAGALARAWW